MIEHSKVIFDEDIIKAVTDVLRNGWILEGMITKEFESSMCNYVGTKYATAVTSGTLGIVLSLKALGIIKGDKVATSSYICRNVIDAIKIIGAEPLLCDISLYDYSIDYKFLEKNFHSKIRCIILPHMFGIPADIDKLKKFGIPIIEDCAQSLGSEYNNKKCGSFGDISVFSFQATKMITTGEGGMILTNNDEIYERIKYFKTSADLNRDFAYNFNYTDIQSAMGIEQLKKIDYYIAKRKVIYNRYYENLKHIDGITLQYHLQKRQTNYFKCIIKVKNCDIRDDIIKEALKCGIKIKMPIAPEPIHSMFNLNKRIFKNCEQIFKRGISIPMYPQLSNEEIYNVINFIQIYFN